MAKYKEYEKGTYTESDRLKEATKQSDYWGNQQLTDFTYDDFKLSDRTNQYQSQLDNLQGPGEFNFSKQQGWDDIINQIMNREKFSYDVNGDALYQQYKDQYITGGKMAMMDTMGQAAAMTGGYGNSYAQAVGQQAYQGYLQQLTDKIPELYSLAMSKYQMEGEDLYNKYGLYSDQYNTEYGQHRDAVGDFQVNRNYLAGRVDSSTNTDLNIYNTNRDTSMAENESRNSNITSNRNHFTDLASQLAANEWNQYLGNEELNQLAIATANDNLYKNEQARLAEEELKNSKSNGQTPSDTPGGIIEDLGISAEALKAMPDVALEGYINGYKDADDGTGLAMFLDYCVEAKRLTSDEADEYFRKYMTGEKEGQTGTEVTGRFGGGGGGRIVAMDR